MATPKYNLKNPGVKRIMQEAKELAKESTYEYSAHPLEDNLFEWHFTVRGPKDTEFDNGRFHGRILLPNEYPFKPPEIMFLTPNGRFELNKKVCLSITGFHPEFWQPAWGIRTVLLAVAGFFPTEAKGAVGGLDYSKEERIKLAKKSIDWECPVCGIHMKDALSDTPPDENIKKEELPSFMLTYKDPTTEETNEVQPTVEAPQQKPEEQSSTLSKEQPSKLSEEESSNETEEQLTNLPESSSSKPKEQKSYPSSPESTQPRFVVPDHPRVLETPVHQNSPRVLNQTQAPPSWLDPLIAALVSFIAVLAYRRYIQ